MALPGIPIKFPVFNIWYSVIIILLSTDFLIASYFNIIKLHVLQLFFMNLRHFFFFHLKK